MDPEKPATRRRGSELEKALLAAAREELIAVGYGRFTIEGVAERAATSRHVIYRRWKTREELALAAMRDDPGRDDVVIADTGSLRGDLIAMLSQANRTRLAMAALFTIHLGAYYAETGTSPAELRAKILEGRPRVWVDVALERAAERGEVDPARLTPRMRSLAGDIFRHEVLMTLKPVSQETIEEIVDDLVLPVLTGR